MMVMMVMMCRLPVYVSATEAGSQPEVTGLSPQNGGTGGAVRITVTGKNFVPGFTLTNDTSAGTHVKLVSGTTEYLCDRHEDGVTSTTATCNTRRMPAGSYNVRVTVNGQAVSKHCASRPSACVFKAVDSKTPKIHSITPSSGLPGSLIRQEALMFTSRAGSNVLSQNDREEKLLRFIIGDNECQVKDLEADQNYGLALYNNSKGEAGNEGFIICKSKSKFIGNMNASFIVEGAFGRSRPDPKLLLVRRDLKTVAMFQQFTELDSVSHATGSTEGGHRLTLGGSYFDDTRAPVRAELDGQAFSECSLVSDTQITCLTPPQSTPAPTQHTGHRGLAVTLLKNMGSNYQSPSNDWSTGLTSPVDEAHYSNPGNSSQMIKMAGVLVAPSDGLFRFYFKARGGGVLNVTPSGASASLVSVTSTKFGKGDGEMSDAVTLEKDKEYSLEALSGSTGEVEVQVGLKLYNTSLLPSQSGMVDAEIQRININSVVVRETQNLVVTSSGVVTGRAEKQQVVLTGDLDASLRLGFYGAFTEPLKVSATDGGKLAAALNKLPSMATHTATVLHAGPSANGNTRTYTITFPALLGNVPGVEVEMDSAACTAAVSTLTQGQSTQGHYRLQWGGTVTDPIPVNATASQVKQALQKSAGVRCHEKLRQGKVLMDCETAGSCFGRAVGDQEPLCGHKSARNPGTLYHHYGNLEEAPRLSSIRSTLCLGHKGPLSSLWVTYGYVTQDQQQGRSSLHFAVTVPTDHMAQWRYTCKDVYTDAKNRHGSVKTLYLLTVGASRDDNDTLASYDLFADQLVLREGLDASFDIENSAAKLRMPQARPNQAFIQEVQVTGTPNNYTVQLVPHNCAHTFPLLSLDGATTSDSLAAGSDSATLTVSSGMSVTVTRVARASPEVSGFFNVTFDGETSQNIAVSSDLKQMETIVRDTLSLVNTLGDVDVTQAGHCAAFTFTVTLTSKAGAQSMMTVDGSGLAGNQVTHSVSSVQQGGVRFAPIPGDMLRTLHSKPQVTVYINNIPTRCSNGSDCGYTYSGAHTPTITSITPTSGTLGTAVTITGTSFDNLKSDNAVTLGPASCEVTLASPTSLECTASMGPAGPRPVAVRVASKGLASGAVNFTYEAVVSDIDPTSGGYMGGIVLTVTGQGFGNDTSVTVGGESCPVLTANWTQVQCRLPAYPAKTDGSVPVTVQTGGETLTAGSQFTYSSSSTPQITALSTNNVRAPGGDEITITGTGFGSAMPAVSVNDVALTVATYNSTQVVVRCPPLNPGAFPLLLLVMDQGYADSAVNVTIEVILKVTGVSPERGSQVGGTLLSITGQGFGTNSSLVEVKVGRYDCGVKAVADTLITCRVGDTGSKVTVTNQGRHKDYGQGYAWQPKHLSIQVGDTVRWQWTTPSYVSGIAYRLQQVANNGSNAALPAGFASPGASTANGVFEHRFTTPGTHVYWSGYVNAPFNTIYLRGQVVVTPKPATLNKVTVKVGGPEAEHVVSSSSRKKRAASSGCGYPTAGCQPVNLTATGSAHQFTLDPCATPTITSITPRSGTALDNITIEGTSFGTSAGCQNQVFYADDTTGQTVTTTSGSQMTFTLDTARSPPIRESHPFRVNVGDLGDALVAIGDPSARLFALLPSVLEDISPKSGSLGGDTSVTIKGAGLSGVAVSVNGGQCRIQSQTYHQVICLTPPSSSAQDVTVSVTLSGSALPCPATFCQFAYDGALTPSITDVTPNSINSPWADVTISGSGFGSEADNVTVTVGGVTCTVLNVTDVEIQCRVHDVPAGTHAPQVVISGKGKATGQEVIQSVAQLDSLSPVEGSVHGGTSLTLKGHGFSSSCSVTLSDVTCTVTSHSGSVLTCVTPAHTAQQVQVGVTCGGVAFPAKTFTFSSAATPTVTGVTPPQGQAGVSVALAGSGFTANASSTKVEVGGQEVTVTGVTPDGTSVQAVLGSLQTGTHAVRVHVPGKGWSNGDVSIQYSLGDFTFSPLVGAIGGNQTLTFEGSGFLPNGTQVTLCGRPCTVLQDSVNATHLQCRTSPYEVTTPTGCDVTVSVNDVNKTATQQFRYDNTVTPHVTGVTPKRGGTAGGTTLTITGIRFGTDKAALSVTVGGATCDVLTVNDTHITCTTNGARSGTYLVRVVRDEQGNGTADPAGAEFRYIDRWSSVFTWGGGSLPAAGDLVVIPKGQIILLDTNTPVLALLLIKGQLIFDEASVEVAAEIILITDGGILQVGTESNPFPLPHVATITLHGHLRSKELPLYGTKSLGVREGTLDLHGQPVTHTWTLLAQTAAAGSQQITLITEVDWKINDELVLASTSHRHSQNENEVHVITNVSADKRTLTLREALKYEHVAVTHTLDDGSVVTTRGEVGLLTRNVRIRGSRNSKWEKTIPACPDGFETGEFATQTCFQGRFGEEMGSDQFGAQLMVHGATKDSQKAQAHISFAQFSYVGQAFRLGRYPIHFHLNGNSSQSYVRGVAIRDSFNRAVNIHGTHNVLVEHSVVYNIMGGALFLEDGDETGNTFQYNLAVFVKASSSLRNDDITPAALWVTNPNNIIRHNHMAGGTHFGAWYRMHTHPDGPGFDPNICPQNVPLGIFQNNTAHSLGWFGLWIFETYTPRVGGGCSSTATQVAVFETLTAWNCEKGAELVNGGAVQFKDFVVINNEKAGIEFKLVLEGPLFNESDGTAIRGGHVVGHLGNKLKQEGSRTGTKAGIVLPYHDGLLVQGVHFHNLNSGDSSALEFTSITGHCSFLCGGYTVHTKDLHFHSVSKKVRFRWAAEGVLKDVDGSLTGSAGNSVVTFTGDLPPQHCTQDSSGGPFSAGSWPGAVCGPQVRFLRFSFNKPVPTNLLAKDARFTNQYGTTVAKYAIKRISHKEGWMTTLVSGESYDVIFENASPVANLSFDGAVYLLKPDDHVTLSMQAEKPSRFTVTGSQPFVPMSAMTPDPATQGHGSWWYNQTNGTIVYLVKGPASENPASVTPRLNVKLRASTCFYEGCKKPDPTSAMELPANAKLWSDANTWSEREGGKPQAGDNITIPLVDWIVIDEDLPPFDHIVVDGALSAAQNASLNVTLSVNSIRIYGRMVVGWPDDPFNGTFRIVLRGSKASPHVPINDGPVLGAKVIGVYGGLDLHGLPSNVTWTSLASPVESGSLLHVQDAVDWAVGDEVMVTPTDGSPWHVEVFRLTGLSQDRTQLSLNDSVKFRHLAHTQPLSSGGSLEMRARVARLTRNIVVEGESYDNLQKESFGARIVFGRTSRGGESYSGYGRVTNTEFFHTGQEGYMEPFDPRFSLAYVDTPSLPAYNRSSYVRHNAFHHGFSPAVGVTASDDVEISHNVIHHTVGNAIFSNSKATRVIHNLISLVIFPGSYQDRREEFNIEYEGAIEATAATDLTLRNNVVAGCERVAYHLAGQQCSTAPQDRWKGNEAHSCLLGVASFPTDKTVNSTCTLWSGFYVWKMGDAGVYINGGSSQEVEDVTSVENGLGYTGFVVGPSATGHQMASKYVRVRNSTFVGRTSTHDCVKDALNQSDANVQLSSQSRFWRKSSCGMVAIMLPTFTSGSNKAPEKPLTNIMAYQALQGKTLVSDVKFERFQGNAMDFLLASNRDNEDMQHTVFTSEVVTHHVDTDNLAFFHRPRTGPINPSDCVDMNCDGLKKPMVVDQDGSLLGTPGTILPDSAYQWDGAPAYGLGDYRIPKVMLTDKNGDPLDAAVVAPNKGIYRGKNCTFRSQWNAYLCDSSVQYAMLTIESMDADTETRRLSPVAVFSGGYVDLLNGPQDHGWCSGYTCRKRLSTFPAIVPLGRSVALYMTGTVPDKIRFMLLNVGEGDCVVLSIWKRHSNRMDAIVNGQPRLPLNGYMSNGSFFLKTEEYAGQYMPSLENGTMGDYYVNRSASTIHWLQCGPGILQLEKADVVIVSFGLPAVTVDEFFGEQIVNNLAQFLDIPVEKVRIVDIRREDSSGGRRRRSTTPGVYLFLEVGNGPADDGTKVVVDLVKVSDQIVTQAEIYGMDQVLNTTILTISIQDPVKAADSANQTGGGGGGYRPIRKVGSLELVQNPAGATENVPFVLQPSLRFRSSDGTLVEQLGTSKTSWQIEASIVSAGSGQGQLLGNKRMTFVKGVAQFSDLVIDLPGSYVLRFSVKEPKEASNYSLDTLPFQVSKRPVALLGALMTHNPLVNAPIQLSFRLVDGTTNQQISNINWRNHTWTVTASAAHPEVYQGRLEGNTSVAFDPATATAEFKDIRLSDPGLCLVTFTLTSDPPEYRVQGVVEVPVMTKEQWRMVVERKVVVEVRLSAPYQPDSARGFAAMLRNSFNRKEGTRVIAHAHRAGSIVVTLTIEGTQKGVDAILGDLCKEAHQGTAFTYSGTTATLTQEVRVDGKDYYGDVCYPETGLHPGVIAAIVLACVLVIVVVVFLLLWRFKVYPKTKTFDAQPGLTSKYTGTYRTDLIEDVLFRDDTFLSLKNRDTPTPLPPVTTALDASLIQWKNGPSSSSFFSSSSSSSSPSSPSDLPPMPGTPDPPRRPVPEASSRTLITPKPAQTDF